MRNIAIFVEGQSEQIFVRNLLAQVIGWNKLCFTCMKLNANWMEPVAFKHESPDANVYFLIVNVGNDERVLSAIKDREEHMFLKGFEKIIALRDMYSESYCEKSDGVIDDNVTKMFIESWKSTIQEMSEPNKIKMHIAIMELEAWFLGMYHIFEKINSKLSVDYIESELRFNLTIVDPQKEFFHPTEVLDEIFGLIKSKYQKSQHEIESFCSRITHDDIRKAFENERCKSFKYFYEEILN